MKELLADILRKMFGNGAQTTPQTPTVPTLQNAARQVHAPTRQAYLQYVEEAATRGEQAVPFAQWAAQQAK